MVTDTSKWPKAGETWLDRNGVRRVVGVNARGNLTIHLGIGWATTISNDGSYFLEEKDGVSEHDLIKKVEPLPEAVETYLNYYTEPREDTNFGNNFGAIGKSAENTKRVCQTGGKPYKVRIEFLEEL